jgi:hypothetical protein
MSKTGKIRKVIKSKPALEGAGVHLAKHVRVNLPFGDPDYDVII